MPARRSNQSLLKEISPEYSLEGLMLKLKLQYFGCLIWTSWLIGNDPDAGKDWSQKKKGTAEDKMIRFMSTNSMHIHLRKFQETVEDREAWSAIVHGVARSHTWLKWLNNKVCLCKHMGLYLRNGKLIWLLIWFC